VLFKREFVLETGFCGGAHLAKYEGKKRLNEYVSKGDLKLLHYKYIDLEYVINKHEQYNNRRSDFNKKHGFGLHYGFTKQKIESNFKMLKLNAKQIEGQLIVNKLI
jgi:hypothetical protein